MPVNIDPNHPLHVTIDFQSVHAAAYRLRARLPGRDWETFAMGTQNDDMATKSVGPLPPGSELQYRFLYLSTVEAFPFRAALTIRQNGVICPGGVIPVTGDAGKQGVEGEISLS